MLGDTAHGFYVGKEDGNLAGVSVVEEAPVGVVQSRIVVGIVGDLSATGDSGWRLSRS